MPSSTTFPAKERKKSIEELLELVDLTKWRDAATKTLSGGMRRRLEIARGLVHHPQDFLSRRAHDRTRSGLARRRLGDAGQHQGAPAADHPDHDALHG